MNARRPWAWPLVPGYAAALAIKDALPGKPKKLAWPVVSIGSISAGGAGKTPVVIALAALLTRGGSSVDVLSRGYGRNGTGVERVLPGDAKRFGDEPTLIAERTGVPVWVGAERHAAGEAAEAANSDAAARHLHLLDDGFQHRQLSRAVDIVLVTAEDLTDALLPAGNRREPFAALKRASAVVVREKEMHFVSRAVARWTDAPVWPIRRKLEFDSPLAVLGAGLRPMGFCGIARPEEFQEMVRASGCGLVDTMAYPDHHAYTKADIAKLCDTARGMNVSGFVTTEKDAVKLTDTMRAKLAEIGPLLIARLEVEFLYPATVLRLIEERAR